MRDSTLEITIQTRAVGDAAIIYASDYFNKISGEKIERECQRQFDSGRRTLIINFRDTELINSIGVSILVGLIDAAEQNTARLIFSNLNSDTANLFEMLGLTRHVSLATNEDEALAWIATPENPAVSTA